MVALVICLTLIVAVFVAKIVGCTLPMFAKKVGFDPAVMASPFITTIVDALSLIIYFRLRPAAAFLVRLRKRKSNPRRIIEADTWNVNG